jgi:uncharacterized protein YlxP (DUF503 family)
MFVVAVRCELHLPAVHSLKGKRAILNRLKDRLRANGRAAVAEVDHNDLWQRTSLGVVVVSGEAGHADQMMDAVRRDVEKETSVVLLDWQVNRY